MDGLEMASYSSLCFEAFRHPIKIGNEEAYQKEPQEVKSEENRPGLVLLYQKVYP